MPVDRKTKLYIDEAVTIEDRQSTAESCILGLKISVPCLLDDMDDSTARAYQAHPDRIYFVGKHGRLQDVGPPGPEGFNPDELKPYLKRSVGAARIRA